MNFAALKLNFKEYLLKNAELPEERKELESGDVSIFDYTDEFKEYLSKEYNIDTSDFFQNLRILSQYEIVDGQLVFPGDEEEVSDEAAENQDVDETDTDEIDMEGEYDPENLMVDMMNELLQDEQLSKTLDRDGNGEVDTEEMQSFFDTISSIDGDDTNVSLEDITGAVTQIQEGEFEFVDETSEESKIQTTSPASTASSSYGPGSISTTKAKEKTISNMSLEELTSELSTQQSSLENSQSELQDLISGENSQLKSFQKRIDTYYDQYLDALEEVDVDMAEQLNDIVTRLDEKEQEIDEKDGEIANANADVTDKQNSYNSAVSQRNNLRTIVSSLEAEIAELEADNEEGENDDEIAELERKLEAAEKELEIAEANVVATQAALTSAQANLETLEEQKETLENELQGIEEEKTKLEEQIAEAYPAVDKMMQNYNNLKTQYNATKEKAINEVQSTISTTQSTITEIQNAITEKKNKAATKEYLPSNMGETLLEYAQSFIGYSESDGSADLFLNGSSSSKTPWCAAFVEYAVENFGDYDEVPDWYKDIDNKWLCQNIYNAASSASAIIDSSEAQTGDLVVFDWGNDGSENHIGIYCYTGDDGTIYTIEGNTNDGVVAIKSYSPDDKRLTFCKITS